MGVRDEEIQRLIHYAKGLGVKVIIYSKSDANQAATWTTDGTLIELYAGKNRCKTQIILDLIHELGHQVWFIHEKDRQPDLKFEEALDRPEDSTPKHLRKKIYDEEVAATAWWESIYKETDIKIPKWKLFAQMEFDMWMYEQYYETGKFPKGKRKKDRLVEVKAKHKAKSGNKDV